MTYKGKDYPFKVEGLSVVDVGITKAEAEGRVHNMKKRGDFTEPYQIFILYMISGKEGSKELADLKAILDSFEVVSKK